MAGVLFVAAWILAAAARDSAGETKWFLVLNGLLALGELSSLTIAGIGAIGWVLCRQRQCRGIDREGNPTANTASPSPPVGHGGQFHTNDQNPYRSPTTENAPRPYSPRFRVVALIFFLVGAYVIFCAVYVLAELLYIAAADTSIQIESVPYAVVESGCVAAVGLLWTLTGCLFWRNRLRFAWILAPVSVIVLVLAVYLPLILPI